MFLSINKMFYIFAHVIYIFAFLTKYFIHLYYYLRHCILIKYFIYLNLLYMAFQNIDFVIIRPSF